MEKKQAQLLFQDVCDDLKGHLSEDDYDYVISTISNAFAVVSGENYGINLSREHACSSNLNEKYTFENFIVGSANNFAHAASLAVAQSTTSNYNPLFIYGSTGIGKTHLMQAIANQVLKKYPNKKVCYLSCEKYLNEYIDSLKNRTLQEFRAKFRNMDVLLIDDIHFLIGKDQLQEEFFHTFNALYENQKQIVLTCDRPASELTQLQDRLISRLERGLVAQIQMPDSEMRLQIVQKKAELMNLNLPNDLLVLLAERINSNIYRLEGALIRVSSYILLNGEFEITEIKDLLKDVLD